MIPAIYSLFSILCSLFSVLCSLFSALCSPLPRSCREEIGDASQRISLLAQWGECCNGGGVEAGDFFLRAFDA